MKLVIVILISLVILTIYLWKKKEIDEPLGSKEYTMMYGYKPETGWYNNWLMERPVDNTAYI